MISLSGSHDATADAREGIAHLFRIDADGERVRTRRDPDSINNRNCSFSRTASAWPTTR